MVGSFTYCDGLGDRSRSSKIGRRRSIHPLPSRKKRMLPNHFRGLQRDVERGLRRDAEPSTPDAGDRVKVPGWREMCMTERSRRRRGQPRECTAVSPSSVYAPDAPKRLSCVNIVQINFRTSEPSTFGCIIRQWVVENCLLNAYIPVA